MRKKIFIVIRKLDLGGAEKHIATYLSHINKELFSVTILVIYKNGSIEHLFYEQGFEVIKPHSKLSTLAKIEMSARLLILMLKYREAIFHLWLPEAYIIGGICGLITNHKFVIMSRRSLNFYQNKHVILKRIEFFLHKRTRLFLCNSKKIKEQLIQEGADQHKINIIYNGVNSDAKMQNKPEAGQRKALNINSDTFIITCVANLIPYKGHIDLLNAVCAVKKALNLNFKLVCIGRDDGIKPTLENIIKDLDLQNNVIFTGEIKNVYDYLKISDLNVLPSHEEGMPNAVLEAMSVGIPTIATTVGGIPEIIDHNITGILVQPNNPDNLAYEIIRLIKDNKLRLQIGKNGKAHTLKNFSSERCASLYEEAYKSI